MTLLISQEGRGRDRFSKKIFLFQFINKIFSLPKQQLQKALQAGKKISSLQFSIQKIILPKGIYLPPPPPPPYINWSLISMKTINFSFTQLVKWFFILAFFFFTKVNYSWDILYIIDTNTPYQRCDRDHNHDNGMCVCALYSSVFPSLCTTVYVVMLNTLFFL